MKKQLRFFCLTLLAMLANAQAIAQDFADHAVIKEAVSAAYEKGNFSALDKMGTKFRTEKSRTPNGLWHLWVFHTMLHAAMDEERKNSPGKWSDVESKINRWVASVPQSAVAPIALAKAQRSHAWELRGSGMTNTVTKKGWEGFSRYLATAHRTLQTNKKIASVDPHWYVEMLGVALAENWEKAEYTALYEEAMSKEPLYHETHVSAVERYLPMWGGSVKEIQEFANQAVQRTAAMEGKGMYAHIYWHVIQRIGQKQLYAKPDGSLWPQISAGFEDVIKKYPTDWNRNIYARIACEIGMMNTFKTVARQFNGRPDKDAWPGNFYETCKNHVNKIVPSDPLL